MRIIYSPAKFADFQSFCITHGKLMLSEKRYQFAVRNTIDNPEDMPSGLSMVIQND